MAERIAPTLDQSVLCNSIEYDRDSVVFALNEPLHTVRLEPDANGELRLPVIYLFAQMSDQHALGTFHFRIEVRCQNVKLNDQPASDGITVRFEPRDYPPEPFEQVFAIRDLVLPHAGDYHFHVMFSDHMSLNERPGNALPALLRVVRAEPAGASR